MPHIIHHQHTQRRIPHRTRNRDIHLQQRLKPPPLQVSPLHRIPHAQRRVGERERRLPDPLPARLDPRDANVTGPGEVGGGLEGGDCAAEVEVHEVEGAGAAGGGGERGDGEVRVQRDVAGEEVVGYEEGGDVGAALGGKVGVLEVLGEESVARFTDI